MNEEPPKKGLAIVSFALHSARGLVRDQNTRRKAMFVVLVAALVMLFSGSTFLYSTLNWHDHPFVFILFWFVCGWLTVTAMLLAVFDMLMLRAEARRAARNLRAHLSESQTQDSQSESENE